MKQKMEITDNFRKKNKKNRLTVLIFVIIGICVLIVVPQIISFLYSLDKPKSLEIVIPDTTLHYSHTKIDSVLSVFVLHNESIVLSYETGYIKTDLQHIDKFLCKKDFQFLLLKFDNSNYKTLSVIIDKVTTAKIKKFSMVDFKQNELDSVLKTKNIK